MTQETPQEIAATAVIQFAYRWEAQLKRMAAKVKCQCQPERSSLDESEHDPHCPVGRMRQAGRLMCEEASGLVEAARA